MNKGLIPLVIVLLAFLAVPLSTLAEGEIYKVVNPDGSITYTDQKPAPGAEPVELAPLSFVETDIQVPEAVTEEEGTKEPTLSELRRMYRDFGIRQPQHEETFWGTGNMVTIAWGASQPVPDDMRAVLILDGERENVSPDGSVTRRFDRGEHQVAVELRDGKNRRIVGTEPVVFFVKQHSVNFNRPRPTPRG